MGKFIKKKWFSLSLFIFSLLVYIPKKGLTEASNITITSSRNEMLDVAKELHPPGCTDSMTADYCTLSTAYDLREEISTLLDGGMNKEQVIDYLVQKYGDRILAAPAAEGFNLIIWFLPILGLVLGLILVVLLVKKWLKSKRGDEVVANQQQLVTDVDASKIQEELKNWL
ncbi:cytochrome c-type biogenesis protein CcmH [Cytobacillus sp. S13-E01]|uniref:cytochrome c-type biogenesis protein n=1 Tax=Cytobacillus sp. S13-E01 TaxID=3031326 RepID=UPI0023D85A94|nr:cytochrome c-type biogenesis protein CcmH [Cytobacillus sp. S13-E01]MDF0727704.1 cytochrome c-type biogenesis protein CcmH [Cytobacillus sp. S13-E01]